MSERWTKAAEAYEAGKAGMVEVEARLKKAERHREVLILSGLPYQSGAKGAYWWEEGRLRELAVEKCRLELKVAIERTEVLREAIIHVQREEA